MVHVSGRENEHSSGDTTVCFSASLLLLIQLSCHSKKYGETGREFRGTVLVVPEFGCAESI